MHVGIRSKRDHVLTPHPDFEAWNGYKGANDPESPACRPVQTCVSELRPLTALPSDPTPSTVFRKIHGIVSKGSMKSRPRFKVKDETYPGDTVMFKTHIIHGDRKKVEVIGNCLEIRHTTVTRRSYLVRFKFYEKVKHEEIKTYPNDS